MCLQGAQRWRELKQPQEAKRGMCMAVQLFSRPTSDAAAEEQQEQGAAGETEQAERGGQLHAAVGYEDGSLAVWDVAQPDNPIMSCRLHSEAVMALAVDSAGTGAAPISHCICQDWDSIPAVKALQVCFCPWSSCRI